MINVNDSYLWKIAKGRWRWKAWPTAYCATPLRADSSLSVTNFFFWPFFSFFDFFFVCYLFIFPNYIIIPHAAAEEGRG